MLVLLIMLIVSLPPPRDIVTLDMPQKPKMEALPAITHPDRAFG
jgi:hypothetical protein